MSDADVQRGLIVKKLKASAIFDFVIPVRRVGCEAEVLARQCQHDRRRC